MTLLRDGDSINFQKASYTLDGCVKVYSSRIDSVDSETKKLLIGLADKDVPETEESDTPGETVSKKTRRRQQLANTLEDNANLTTDAFELDVAVDPLFQKTAADFDEGGAKGLLLSHLDIAPNGAIIFDASDPRVAEPLEQNQDVDDIDITELKGISFINIDRFGTTLAGIWSQEICPTFSSFVFQPDGETEFNIPENAQDFYADQFEDISDDDEDMFAYDGEGGDTFDESGFPAPPFDQEQDYKRRESNIMQMVESNRISLDDSQFAYFEKIQCRNWAGPEYWKYRAPRGIF